MVVSTVICKPSNLSLEDYRAKLSNEPEPGDESSLATARSNLHTVSAIASSARPIISTLKWAKSLVLGTSTALKVGGAAATPATLGTSALAIAGGFALDIVIGEAIDAGITICNSGRQLDEAKGDYIQGGDWLGSQLYSIFA